MSKLGFDMDGCLSNFNEAYVNLIIQLTGRDLFGDWRNESTFPAVWDYPQDIYGYSQKEIAAVWKAISKDDTFWLGLNDLDESVSTTIKQIDSLRYQGHEVFFITSRPGATAKFQTEAWLMDRGMACPTVLVGHDKAAYVSLLKLDAYIDDYLRNANSVMGTVRVQRLLTRVYLLDAPYNQRPVCELKEEQYAVATDERDPGLIVVGSVREMLEKESLWQ